MKSSKHFQVQKFNWNLNSQKNIIYKKLLFRNTGKLWEINNCNGFMFPQSWLCNDEVFHKFHLLFPYPPFKSHNSYLIP